TADRGVGQRKSGSAPGACRGHLCRGWRIRRIGRMRRIGTFRPVAPRVPADLAAETGFGTEMKEQADLQIGGAEIVIVDELTCAEGMQQVQPPPNATHRTPESRTHRSVLSAASVS